MKNKLPTYIYDYCTTKKQKDWKNSYVRCFTGHIKTWNTNINIRDDIIIWYKQTWIYNMDLITGFVSSFSSLIYFNVWCFRFKDHPILNERYLLLNLLGKGGFSEVHKVCTELLFQTIHHWAFKGDKLKKLWKPMYTKSTGTWHEKYLFL